MLIYKSPQYTRCDFMFFYRFVCCRRLCRRQLQILVHVITFEQFFRFLSFLAWLLALTHRLPYEILVDFRRDLDWPWIFKIKYGICYISAKNGPIAMKWKANISIEPQASNVTIGFDIDHDLDRWIFKVKCDLDLWPHTLPWPWIAVSQNGRADLHCTKGVGVGYSWL